MALPFLHGSARHLWRRLARDTAPLPAPVKAHLPILYRLRQSRLLRGCSCWGVKLKVVVRVATDHGVRVVGCGGL